MKKELDFYTPEEREFDRMVVSAILNFEESIDITKFVEEYCWDCEQIACLFDDVLWNNPQIFLSDEAIKAKGHLDWDVRGLPPANDKTYDSWNWDRKI